MAAISNRSPAVKVEYTNSTGKLVSKQFTNPYQARAYYCRLVRQGHSPQVRKA